MRSRLSKGSKVSKLGGLLNEGVFAADDKENLSSSGKKRRSFRYSFSGYFLKITNKIDVSMKTSLRIITFSAKKKKLSASDVFLIHNSKNDPISDVSRVTYLVHDAAEGANYFYHLGSEV